MIDIHKLVGQLLSGDHFWDYENHIDFEGDQISPKACETQGIVERLEKWHRNNKYIKIHIEMHGGLIEKVFSPCGREVKELVFYTNSNDFSDDDQYEEQISRLYEMIADVNGNDELTAYYRSIQRGNKRTVGLSAASHVYILTESKYAEENYKEQLSFYAEVTHELGNDLFVVKSTSEDTSYVVHIDDIHSPESQAM